MLVLSRKVDQQIMIGEDIVLTVVRMDGNRVRIGIDAPQEKRILRGELAQSLRSELAGSESSSSDDCPLDRREMAFAHPVDLSRPQVKRKVDHAAADQAAANTERTPSRGAFPETSQVFQGKVNADGSAVRLQGESAARRGSDSKQAPLSGFVAAT
jgi:carbon storage regulator